MLDKLPIAPVRVGKMSGNRIELGFCINFGEGLLRTVAYLSISNITSNDVCNISASN